MCGLQFVITSDAYATKSDDFLKQCLIANQVRGMHSTGLFQVEKNGAITTLKRAVNASEFIEIPQARGIIAAAPRSMLTVGHTRHATQGSASSDANAHPFVVVREDKSKLVGVHNGSLIGWKNKEGGDKQDVDSAWAFDILAKEGPVDAFEYFNGPFAFIWYDSKDPDHVYMARNSDRPLHYLRSEDGKTVLGCSELGLLGWIAERNGIKGHDNNTMYYLSPGKVYKFSLKEPSKFECWDFPKYNPETTIVKPAPVVALTHSSWNQRRDYYNSYRAGEEIEPGDEWFLSRSREIDDRVTRSRVHTGHYFNQKYVLDSVKEVLRKSRDARMPGTAPFPEENEVVTAEDLNDNLEEAIQSELSRFHQKQASNEDKFDVWLLIKEPQFVGVPNESSVTSQERKRARDDNKFGQVVAFSGVIYDPDTGELFGEYSIEEKGKVVTKDAILRGMTSAYSESKYIQAMAPQPVTIVGLFEGDEPGADNKIPVYAVVSEMTASGMKLLTEHQQRSRMATKVLH
jgi:hypothetical protein